LPLFISILTAAFFTGCTITITPKTDTATDTAAASETAATATKSSSSKKSSSDKSSSDKSSSDTSTAKTAGDASDQASETSGDASAQASETAGDASAQASKTASKSEAPAENTAIAENSVPAEKSAPPKTSDASEPPASPGDDIAEPGPDSYEMGADSLPSVTNVLATPRKLVSSDSGDGSYQDTPSKTWDYTYESDTVSDDLEQYLNTLRNTYDYVLITDMDLTQVTGAVSLAAESVDDGLIIVLDCNWDGSGYKLAFSKFEGTLTKNDNAAV